LLQRLGIADPTHTILFTCGPEVMMTYTIQTALSRGIPTENIWVSLERHMNCGIGHCGHCQLGPLFVCKDGPVIRYDDVERLMEVKSL
jgi:NAD(P)H-flavin reductase